MIETNELEQALKDFASDRDWEQFHTPKNLTLALAGEVGELCELVQWKSDTEIADEVVGSEAFADEVADILIYTVRLASVAGIDLDEAVIRKLAKNAERYPADVVKGSSEKQA